MRPLRFLVRAVMFIGFAAAGFGQGTAFLYQGQLSANGFPANGLYDLTFTLWSTGNTAGPTLTNLATTVSNGLFAVALDYGPGVFDGSDLWLQIGVRTNGGSGFVSLAPPQPIMPSPYAITAANLAGPLPAAQLSGAYPGNIMFDNPSNSFAGAFSGDGGGLTNVNAALLDGLAGSNYASSDALMSYATVDFLTNYATLEALTNYATVEFVTNYFATASVSNSAGSSPVPNMQVFDSPTTTSFTVPAGVTQIAVEVWGGGGGGGNAGSSSSTAGGGGGAGGYGKATFAVSPGDIYVVVVGAGGAPGTSGGDSSFGNLISTSGGSGGTSSQASGAGGVGGGSIALINITGGSGQWNPTLGGSYGGSAGNGGSGGLGDAGAGGNHVGGAGQAPGGGGGGGYDFSDPGGAGGHGRVIVYY